MPGNTEDIARQLDEMTLAYLAETRKLEEGNLEFASETAVRKAAHADWQRVCEGNITRQYDDILAFIKEHEDVLIAKGKRSFTTSAAVYQFTTVRARDKIANSEAIMRMARKLHVVKQVATPPRTGWKFSAKLFWNFLQKNPTQRQHFERWIEHGEERESLSIKPNHGHPVTHDSQRISPPPVTPPRTSPA